MNVAIIFAGGTGKRMNTKTVPKQFLELHGKPILIYTLEQFEQCEEIDGIVLVCLEDWIPYCRKLIKKFGLQKISAIVGGGETGMLSRYNGIRKAAEIYPGDTVCLLHDGVRPLINGDTICRNIECVKKYGSSITVTPATETVAVSLTDTDNVSGDKVGTIFDRNRCRLARAPQCFRLRELLQAHEAFVNEGVTDCIDTALLMQQRGYPLYTVEGPVENIKITTPMDFYFFKAVIDMKENSQIFGV